MQFIKWMMAIVSLTRLTPLLCMIIFFSLVHCTDIRTGKANYEQAELMIVYLRGISERKMDAELVDAILDTKGMDLIIEQQNKRATINREQYRILLLNLPNDEVPDIEPVDSTERAKLGVHRLKNNVWPSLKWAIKNIDLLDDRLAFLNDLDVANQAKSIADSYLPELLQSIPAIFIVVGGRAGFYAGADCIYMDLLNMSYSPKGVKPLVRSEIIDFFAHEMHHIGFHKLRKNKLNQLRLSEKESRAFGFISGLVAEGSATYLINGHRDFNLISSHRRYARYFGLENDLREICEGIVQSILDGHIQTDDDYTKATEQLLGMGYHASGSLIFHVIYQAGGLEPTMRVLKDPRLFFLEYNKAAKELMARSESDSIYVFDEGLANAIAIIGE